MRNCPACGRSFSGDTQFCPDDGTSLVAPSRDPLVGRVIGERYRLDERLGRGAMGTVYRALHTRMDKPVAVKLLRAELAGDAEAVARFQREARSASRLDHEHCIRVTDFGQTDDGLLYLVMELLDGESLSAQVERGPLPPPVVAAIGADVASALAHAHEYGVIHRDLKPDNVVLARRGRRSAVHTVVKVLDFGLAKIAGEVGGASVTRAGSVFGTPEYMAPEQAEGLPLDARSDLYSLGAMLYHLTTGQLPFRAANVIQLLAQHVEEPPEPPRKRRPDLKIPAPLEEVILRCLAKRPDQRFPDATAVMVALKPIADHAALDRLLDEAPTLKKQVPAALQALKAAARASVPAANAATSDATSDAATEDEAADDATTDGAATGDAGTGDTAIDDTSTDDPATDDAVTDDSTRDDAANGAGRSAPVEADEAPRPRRGRVIAAIVVVAAIAAAPIALLMSRAPAVPAVDTRPPGLAEARRLLDAGKLDAAESLLASERAAHDGGELQMLLGELAQRRGERLKALAHLHRAAKLEPRVPERHVRLAAALREFGQPEAACTSALEALRLAPKDPAALEVARPCPPPHP